jgi:hypothetical protein
MKILDWKNRGITARLMLIATLPVMLMFVSRPYSYFCSQEVRQELDEQGHLIASLLGKQRVWGHFGKYLLPGTYNALAAAGRQEHPKRGNIRRRQPLPDPNRHQCAVG